MAEDNKESETRIKRAWGVTAAWIAGITTVLGFVGTLTGAFSSISDHLHRHKQSDAQIAVAQTEVKEGEYGKAAATYAAILKADPGYKAALEAQLAMTEQWVEDMRFYPFDDLQTRQQNAASLDEIASVLEEALSRAKVPTQKADIQAHIGWDYWLSYKFLGRDISASPKDDFRAALALDPNNAYANAMLGNYILQTSGNLAEASHAFDLALASGRAHAFVRLLQVTGLTYLEEPGARAALMKVLDEMRKNNEPLDADRRLNARGFCCIPSETTHEHFVESLSAVPADDAMQTYIWLNETNTDMSPSVKKLHQLFVRALLTEIAGDRASALQQLRDLNRKIANINSSLDQCVPEEIERLTAASRAPARG